MYNISAKQPTSGSYVRVWEYGGQIYCDSFVYTNGHLYIFCDASDSFKLCENEAVLTHGCTNVRYLTQGEA